MAHSLHAEDNYQGGWVCDVCHITGTPDVERWFCRRCDADLCFACYPRTPLDALSPGEALLRQQEEERRREEEEQLLLSRFRQRRPRRSSWDWDNGTNTRNSSDSNNTSLSLIHI